MTVRTTRILGIIGAVVVVIATDVASSPASSADAARTNHAERMTTVHPVWS